jgi:hypothetical protein
MVIFVIAQTLAAPTCPTHTRKLLLKQRRWSSVKTPALANIGGVNVNQAARFIVCPPLVNLTVSQVRLSFSEYTIGAPRNLTGPDKMRTPTQS